MLLLIGLLVITGIAVSRSIMPTIQLVTDCWALDARLMDTEGAAEELQALRAEHQVLRSRIGDTSLSSSDVRSLAIDEVIGFGEARGLELVELPEIQVVMENDYELYTHRLVVEGGFHDLLELQSYVERDVEGLQLSSVRYFTQKERRTKKNKLYVELVFQNIRKV